MADSSLTKRALASALKQLMTDQPLQKISIGDICQACMMSRKSFYYHFRDKYDLMNWIFYTEFVERILSQDVQEENALLRSICEYFYENRAFYLNALEHTGQNSFPEYFAEVMQPILSLYFADLTQDDEAHDFLTGFYADAFLAAIRRWLNDGSMPPERFIPLITRAIKKPYGSA